MSNRRNVPGGVGVALGLEAARAQRTSGITVKPAAEAAGRKPAAEAAGRKPAAEATGGGTAPALRGGAVSIPDFERVYSEHFHHVARWARAFGGLEADVDDLTQEVFIVVRRKLAQFDGRSLPAWLYGITRKTVSDYRRRAWLRRILHGVTRSLDASPAEAVSVPGVDAVERLEARRILRRVLEDMSQVRRSAFILFEIEGYSGEEIAALEQIPLATVYTRLHHARKDFLRLTAQLTGQDSEEPPR